MTNDRLILLLIKILFENMEEPQEINIEEILNYSQYYQDPGQQGDHARELLYNFDNNPIAYQYSTQILDYQNAPVAAKVHAIGALKTLVLKMWNDLSDEDRNIYRNYIFDFVDKYAAQENIEQDVLIGGDLALVGLLIQEWPENFPDFFTDLIKKANESEFFCFNSIQIIKFFCQQVLECYDDVLAHSQAVKLANCLQEQA